MLRNKKIWINVDQHDQTWQNLKLNERNEGSPVILHTFHILRIFSPFNSPANNRLHRSTQYNSLPPLLSTFIVPIRDSIPRKDGIWRNKQREEEEGIPLVRAET